jgi:hypothetical protein
MDEQAECGPSQRARPASQCERRLVSTVDTSFHVDYVEGLV